ncbi:MAG: DnaB-like helicase C-terminal domain-containing protein [Syntrophomonas sp.]
MSKRSHSSAIIPGLQRVSDIGDWDPSDTLAIRSGFLELDNILAGGFRPGELTIWSGMNSSGKSTLLGQILLEAVDQGQAVCAYSGELPDRIFRYWIELQAAGPQNLIALADPEKVGITYRPKQKILGTVRDWYRDRLFLYQGGEMRKVSQLIEVFTRAAKEYSCRVFLLDNLTMTVSRLHARDQYRAQRELILETVRFVRENAAHVHIVVHPRKTVSVSGLTKNDIGGSGDITNLADNVLVLARPGAKEKVEKEALWAARLTVLKNRFGGRQNEDIYLDFDPASRRFYPVGSNPEDRVFGWSLLAKTPVRRKTSER